MNEKQPRWQILVVIVGLGLTLVLAGMALACSHQTAGSGGAPPTETPTFEAAPVSTGASASSGGVATGGPTPTETTPAPPAQPVAIVPVLPGGGPTVGPATQATAGQDTTVSLAADGATIRLRVGDRFLLNLGDPYIWNVSVADPSIVSRVVNIAVIRGAQGVYEAHTAGETRLEAVGDLACRQSRPPCLAPSRLFRLTIVVS
jgi:hypothetical protein